MTDFVSNFIAGFKADPPMHEGTGGNFLHFLTVVPLATLAAIGEAVAEPAPTRLTRVATPPVRHLAHQLGVDVMAVVGTGRGGQVTRDDVLAALQKAAQQAQQAQAPGAVQVVGAA